MTSPRRFVTYLAVTVALVVIAPIAQAQDQIGLFTGPPGARLVSDASIPARISGQVTVTFHGDAASGCATEGVCPYSGTVVLRPRNASLDIATFRWRGHVLRRAALDYDAGNAPYLAVANVLRSIPGQPGGACADGSGPQEAVASPTAPVRHGVLTIRLFGPDTSVLSTRCAGPLDGDLTSAGPRAPIPLGRALRGRLTLDLSGTRAFAVHGFAGTVSSTVVLHLARARRQAPPPALPPPTKVRRVRSVTERLSLVRVAGRLTATVRGATVPVVCRLLDSCGLTGTLGLVPRVGPASAYVAATGSASRPYRDFLTAMGLSRAGDPRGIAANTLISWASAGRIQAVLSQTNPCTDSVSLHGILVLGARHGGRWSGYAASGPWRTRCPGPLVGGENPLLNMATSVRPAGSRTFTISLRPLGQLEDDGYSVSLHGQLVLTFRRGRITQHVSAQPVI